MSKNKLGGVIVACTVAIVVTLVLVVLPLLQAPESAPATEPPQGADPKPTTGTQEQALAQRATQWSDLLYSVRTLSREQALQQIESFLEPSAARPTRAGEFYEAWAQDKDHKLVAVSVDDVEIDSSGLRATVRLTAVVEWIAEDYYYGMKPGDRMTQTQILKWRSVDNVWYRTMEPAEVILGPIVPADPEPDPEPGPAPEPRTSRTNPAGLYQPVRVEVDDWWDGRIVLELEMLELISGQAAWSMIRDWNMFNDEPERGEEYILAKFRVKIVELEEEPWDINHAQFDVYSATGVMYTGWVSVAGKSPDLSTKLYEGAEHIGYTAFLVRTDDSPAAVYQHRWDENAIWFDLRS